MYVYGLKNCDTCRKAKKWLDEQGRDYTFVDVRADGINADAVDRWVAAVGWEKLLNKRGTTWRQLPDTDKDSVDETAAKALMLAHPALIKRPVFEAADTIVVDFGAAEKDLLSGA